jgi:hypothetical protein
LSVTHNASGTTNVPTLFTNSTQVFIPDNNATVCHIVRLLSPVFLQLL